VIAKLAITLHTGMPTLLELASISKSFGRLLVCNALSFRLEQGAALGILGPNGAGKTTLLNLISGDLPVSSGKILFHGQDITAVPAYKRCRMGIGRTFQIPRPFSAMTVYENVLVGATHGSQKREHESRDRCVDVLQLTGLERQANTLASDLRLLDRKRLELARALATQPTLLLLDEIAGGLTDHEVLRLLDVIRAIRQQGVTIIWIEHIVHALVSSVDQILALNFGTKIAEGKPQDVISSPDFQQIYLGVESVQLKVAES
jgi:branched-chain amino acid transport system ATP-binding protein